MKEQGQVPGPGVSGSSHDHGNCELCDALERQLAEAQEKLNAVDKEIHTVADLNKKTCEHAVCGLARRVAHILKEGDDPHYRCPANAACGQFGNEKCLAPKGRQ